jgi:hypothetical protein
MSKGKRINYEGIEGAISKMMEAYSLNEYVSFEELENGGHFGRTILPMMVELGWIIKESRGIYRITCRITRPMIKDAYAMIRAKYRKPNPGPVGPGLFGSEEKVTPEMMLAVVKHLREHPDMIDNMLQRFQTQIEDQFNIR